MNKNQYDYIIIGGGLAGLQLAMTLVEDSFFEQSSIAIIEPKKKVVQDRSWSFWEKTNETKWDKITSQQWSTALIKEGNELIPLDTFPYKYKSIRSEDFYAFAKRKLLASPSICWTEDEILSVKNNHCTGKKDSYQGSFVFDSRISPEYKKEGILIQQHFKGWVIESSELELDPSVFTMMDFSLGFKENCCFTYILPYSKTKALIEFTFFSPEVVENKVYDDLLQQYIKNELQINHYTILEEEQGNIPMSSYSFEKTNTKQYTKIGTAGGWVKASSGYSFKNTERKVIQLVENLKLQQRPDKGLFKKRFKYYDRILLRVLHEENHLGNKIFKEMYQGNSIGQIFKFLDEKTTFIEEFKIINNFKKAPFLRSLRKEIG